MVDAKYWSPQLYNTIIIFDIRNSCTKYYDLYKTIELNNKQKAKCRWI